MDDVNPFQSPTTDLIDARLVETPDGYWVDGDCLVVASGAVLPPICVVTNQPLGEGDMLRKRLARSAPWVSLLILIAFLSALFNAVLLFLLSVFLLLFFSIVLRRTCWITYGLHRAVRAEYRKRAFRRAFATLALLSVVVVMGVLGLIVPIRLTLVLLLVALLLLYFRTSAIRIVRHRDGMYWIKGISKEFLARLPAPSPPPR